MSHQVDEIGAVKNKNGTYNIHGTKDGDIVTSKHDVKESELEGLLGKDLANNIIKENNKETNFPKMSFKGQDLAVGGEGMKAFYNSILPSQAKKEARRFDKKARVEVVDFEVATSDKAINEKFKNKGFTLKKDGNTTTVYFEGARDFSVSGKTDIEVKRLAVKSYSDTKTAGKQLSIPITPEMRMNLNGAVPLFQQDQGAMLAADGNYIIYALTNPNVSTPLHELAHVYEHYLNEAERKQILNWAGKSKWDTSVSEKFARGFEKYLATGKASNSRLQKLFDNFKAWLTDIYNGIKNSDIDIELNEEMIRLYDVMLADTENKATATAKTKPLTKADAKKKLTQLLDPKSWRNKKKGSKAPAKSKLPKETIDLLKEIRGTYTEDVVNGMEINEINKLVSYVDSLIVSGIGDIKTAEKARKAILKIKELQMTDMIADKKNLKTDINSREEAISELKSGKVIVVDGVMFDSFKEFEKIYEEGSVVSGKAIAMPKQSNLRKGTFSDAINWRIARSFADLDLMFNMFSTTNKTAKWVKDNITSPVSDKSYGVDSDSYVLDQKRIALRDLCFGKKKLLSTETPRLSQKTGIKLTDNQKVSTPDLTVGNIVYLYNALKQSLGAIKFIKAGYSVKDMKAIIDFVNKNDDVKKYSDGLVEIYQGYLPDINKSLIDNGYEGIGNVKTKTKEEVEKKKGLPDEYPDILSLIYGKDNIPANEAYSPISSLGNDVEAMQKASIFSDTFNVSAFAPNSFDRTSGGSLNIRHSDAIFDSYVSGMTNMVHSLALLRNFKSVLSDKNIRLIKEHYGSRFADELQNSVNDVIYGKNNSTKSDEKNYKGASRWLNQANASIMFLNFTSALTQPISFVNYAFEDIDSKVYFKNFTDMLSGDKKMAEARKEFLLDSAFLRRLTKNLSSIELTELQNSEFGEFTKLERASSKVDDLLSKGFIMTTKMDSAAIRFGGIPYYAAKRDELFSEYSKTYKKEEAYKMAKKEALKRTYEVSNSSQQSSNQGRLTADQKNVAYRLILSFNGVAMQYNRKIYKAASDIKNKRGDLSGNIAIIAYYGMAQSIVFNSIKGLLSSIGDDEEDEKRKNGLGRKTNTIVDGFLRGLGVYGIGLLLVKNLLFDAYSYSIATGAIEQSRLSKDLSSFLDIEYDTKTYGTVKNMTLKAIQSVSPPIGKKIRKVESIAYSAGKGDNIGAGLNAIEFVTNVPASRVENVSLAFTEDLSAWHRLSLLANVLKTYEVEKPAKSEKKKGNRGKGNIKIKSVGVKIKGSKTIKSGGIKIK